MQNPEEIKRNLRWIAESMDAKYKPLGVPIGWDGLIGLIPVFGDVLTTLVSVYIVLSASQLGVPISVLARMGVNILIDNVLGGFPVLGWIFDFLYKSNLNNVALLDRYLESPHQVARQSRWQVGGLIIGLLAASMALIAAMAWMLYQFGEWILRVR